MANVGQAIWISGRRSSSGSSFMWSSGDPVVFGLPSSGLTHNYLLMMSKFNMGAQTASSTIGFFCEATGTCMYMRSRALSQYKDRLPRYGIPMLKIRRSRDRLIFNMAIAILVRRHLDIEMASWYLACQYYCFVGFPGIFTAIEFICDIAV